MNIYEQWAYDALQDAGFEGFTPNKDRGVDCIVLSKDFRGRAQRIQIKGSRTYEGGGGAWVQFTEAKLVESTKITDFFLFVWTTPSAKGRLVPQFLVVPTKDLDSRLRSYGKLSAGKYNFYTYFDGATVFDSRDWNEKKHGWPPSDPQRDYSVYLNAWGQITARL